MAVGTKVVVVSPHLDDAVLSVGGTIRSLCEGGADVAIVTVFAGDPEATTPPSYWDASRGEATQGAAVRIRRREDVAAAAELGATTTALPWSDSGYAGARDPEAIWATLRPIVESADVTLLPGWPLSHADHRYTTMLVLEHLLPHDLRHDPSHDRPHDPRLVFYAEQPYSSEPSRLLKGRLRNRSVASLRHALGTELQWRRKRLDADDRAAQDRALAHYAGEIQNLGLRGRWGQAVRRVSGGEWLGTDHRVEFPRELGLN